MAKPKYRRVIVKLSGEALSGPEKFGIHQPTIDRFTAALGVVAVRDAPSGVGCGTPQGVGIGHLVEGLGKPRNES